MIRYTKKKTIAMKGKAVNQQYKWCDNGKLHYVNNGMNKTIYTGRNSPRCKFKRRKNDSRITRRTGTRQQSFDTQLNTVQSREKKTRLLCTFSTFWQASVRDRLIFKTGLCASVVQLLAAYTVQSMHTWTQHPCVPYMTSHTIHTIESRIYRPRLLFERRHAVANVHLLFESGLYSRAAFIQDFKVSEIHELYNTVRYQSSQATLKWNSCFQLF